MSPQQPPHPRSKAAPTRHSTLFKAAGKTVYDALKPIGLPVYGGAKIANLAGGSAGPVRRTTRLRGGRLY